MSVQIFRSISDLARHQHLDARRRAAKARQMHTKMVDELLIEAKMMTAGTVRTKTLRKLGYPFGRRTGSKTNIKTRRTTYARQRGRLPTLPVNFQTGKLYRSWNTQKISRKGFGQSWDLRNSAPYSRYILSQAGTSKMVTRPVWRELGKSARKKNHQLARDLQQL